LGKLRSVVALTKKLLWSAEILWEKRKKEACGAQ